MKRKQWYAVGIVPSIASSIDGQVFEQILTLPVGLKEEEEEEDDE